MRDCLKFDWVLIQGMLLKIGNHSPRQFGGIGFLQMVGPPSGLDGPKVQQIFDDTLKASSLLSYGPVIVLEAVRRSASVLEDLGEVPYGRQGGPKFVRNCCNKFA